MQLEGNQSLNGDQRLRENEKSRNWDENIISKEGKQNKNESYSESAKFLSFHPHPLKSDLSLSVMSSKRI